jgi:hypothetical protein
MMGLHNFKWNRLFDAIEQSRDQTILNGTGLVLLSGADEMIPFFGTTILFLCMTAKHDPRAQRSNQRLGISAKQKRPFSPQMDPLCSSLQLIHFWRGRFEKRKFMQSFEMIMPA